MVQSTMLKFFDVSFTLFPLVTKDQRQIVFFNFLDGVLEGTDFALIRESKKVFDAFFKNETMRLRFVKRLQQLF